MHAVLDWECTVPHKFCFNVAGWFSIAISVISHSKNPSESDTLLSAIAMSHSHSHFTIKLYCLSQVCVCVLWCIYMHSNSNNSKTTIVHSYVQCVAQILYWIAYTTRSNLPVPKTVGAFRVHRCYMNYSSCILYVLCGMNLTA